MSKVKGALGRQRDIGAAAGRKEAIAAAEAVAQRQKPTIVHLEPVVNTDAMADAQIKTAKILEKHLSGLPLPVVDQKEVAAAIKALSFDTTSLEDELKNVSAGLEALSMVPELVAGFAGIQAVLAENAKGNAEIVAALKDVAASQMKMVAAFKTKRKLKFTDNGATLEAE